MFDAHVNNAVVRNAAIEAEERARIERAAANGLSWSKIASIRPIRK